MLQGEHSAILLTFIKLPFVIKIFDLSFFEWPFYTGFTEVLLSTHAPRFYNFFVLNSTEHDKYICEFYSMNINFSSSS